MDENRDPGHAVFGLGNSGSSQPGYSSAPPTEPVPQYLQPPPAAGGKVLLGLIIALAVLSLVSLYLIVSGRKQTAEALSKHADQLNLITRRLDSSDERYAQLSGKFQVTSEKLGLTEQELQRAHALASSLQRQQRDSVQKLNAAIAQKAGAEELNKLQADASNKFGQLTGDLAGTQTDLDATKAALAGAKGELSGAIASTHEELVALARKGDRDYFEFNLARKGFETEGRKRHHRTAEDGCQEEPVHRKPLLRRQDDGTQRQGDHGTGVLLHAGCAERVGVGGQQDGEGHHCRIRQHPEGILPQYPHGVEFPARLRNLNWVG